MGCGKFAAGGGYAVRDFALVIYVFVSCFVLYKDRSCIFAKSINSVFLLNNRMIHDWCNTYFWYST